MGCEVLYGVLCSVGRCMVCAVYCGVRGVVWCGLLWCGVHYAVLCRVDCCVVGYCVFFCGVG